MKKILLTIPLLFFYFISFSQNLTAFTDRLNRLFEFNKGYVNPVEYQEVDNLIVANKFISYSDTKGDYFVRWNGMGKVKISQGEATIYETKYLAVVEYTTILKIVKDYKETILTSYYNSFGYGDSLVVFQDKIGGNLKYYYQDSVVEFAQVIGDYTFNPGEVGANVFVYSDVANNYYGFYQGQFYKLLSTNEEVEFSSGLNMIAFNDPMTQTFVVFDKGQAYDVDSQVANDYQAGRDFVYFKDQADYHKVFYKGMVKDLGFELQDLEVHDSLITFKEADYLKAWYKGEIYTVYNTTVDEFQLDDGIIAYNNTRGGVDALVRGKEITITDTKVVSFALNGNTIVLKKGPSAYSIWWNGRIYDF